MDLQYLRCHPVHSKVTLRGNFFGSVLGKVVVIEFGGKRITCKCRRQ